MKKLSGEDIRDYRDVTGCSMFEAKTAVLRDNCIEAVQEANTVDDLKEVLMLILDGEV